MNYLKYLKVWENGEVPFDDILKLEASLGFELPPILRVFYSTYNTKDIGRNTLLCFLDEQYDSKLQFYSAEFVPDDHINIYDFYRPGILYQSITALKDAGVLSKKFKRFLPIAECNDMGVLLVGVKGKERDKVFIEYVHAEQKIREVATSIFSFFMNYKVDVDEDYLPKGVSASDLFRNWGDDYWRIDKRIDMT